MSRTHSLGPSFRPRVLAALATIVWLASLDSAHAQFVTQQVGGVSIDANGIVTKVRVDELGELLKVRKDALQPVAADLQKSGLRKVSLRQLEAAIAEQHKNGTPLSDDMIYLAGLQRIQYVFVFPEQNDIVLAGPGEGWKLSADGEIVGVTTNRPVLLLDDLLVALRSTEALRQTGISCSIDPTPEGLARFQDLFKNIAAAPSDPAPLMAAVEQAMGPQTITIKGVPEASHFARVLVAADYRMKRLAMAFDEPPIAGLPNYLQMMKVGRGGAGNAMPRWWLAPDYDALVTDGNGLAWEFHKAGVKCMTEDSVLGGAGQLQRTAQKNSLAQQWADNMTSHYDELSEHEPIFGQLRNCMDLAVLAALVSHHNLPAKCGWDMAVFLDPDFKAKRYNAPRTVHTLASVVQKRRGLVVSASGGVAIDPWPLVGAAQAKPELDATRQHAAAHTTSWWWD
ncbi:MAG: DUF1598 domain-containing protein [Pirellulales bacterium]